MPTPTKGPRLGGSPAHERLILANLATALFAHGQITTTHAKAKRLRPFAEKLITAAKRGDLHARRQVMTVVRDSGVVHELFTEIGPRYQGRPGGYTRIVKIGPRRGDNAPMAVIELVGGTVATAASAATSEGLAATATAKQTAKQDSIAALAGEKEEEAPFEEEQASAEVASQADSEPEETSGAASLEAKDTDSHK